jgi:hypothetical protein
MDTNPTDNLDFFELDFTEEPTSDTIVTDEPVVTDEPIVDEPIVADEPIVVADDTLDTDEEDEVIKANFEFLKTQGALLLPEDYEFKATPKGLEEALAHSKTNEKNSIVAELFEAMPDQGKQLLQYYLNGGTDVNQFIDVYSRPSIESLDLEDEKVQEYIVREYLKSTTSFPDAKIEKNISTLKDNFRLKEEAEELSAELTKMEKAQKAAFVESELRRADEIQKQALAARTEFETTIGTLKEINGIPYSKEDANKVVDALYKPVKLSDGTVTTRFNYNLDKALSDPKKIALLNKILESDFKFDFLARNKASEAAKELHKKLKDTQILRGNLRGSGDIGEFDYKKAKLDIS